MKFHEIFLNYSCNASCGFCFNPVEATRAEKQGIPFESLAATMLAAHEKGFRGLKFIGGEVTVRDDLPKIVRLARKIGFETVQLTTNAIRLADSDYARQLIESGVDRFRFSIHGGEASVHDDSLGRRGAFEAALAAVDNVRRSKASLGINCVVHSRNLGFLEAGLLFFYETLKVEDVLLYFVRRQGFMDLPENAEKLELRFEEAARVLRSAFSALQSRGHRSLPRFFHMPPCFLPEFAQLALDWSVDEPSYKIENSPENLVTHPDGTTEPIEAVTHRGKRKVPACRGCRVEELCLGVEESYLARFGDGEIKPLPSETVPS